MRRDVAFVIFNPATAAWAITEPDPPRWTKAFHEATLYDTRKLAEWAAYLIGGEEAIVQIQTVQATWIVTARDSYTTRK